MPLKLNIGVNRKVGEPNYGSRGASAHLEIEFDGSLLEKPEELRQRMRRLYELARSSVDEELRSSHPPAASANTIEHRSQPRTLNGTRHSDPRERSATQSQIRALHVLSRRNQVDLELLCRSQYGAQSPEDLSVKAASELIDELGGLKTPAHAAS